MEAPITQQDVGPNAGSIMTTAVVTLTPTVTVIKATEKLIQAGVSNAPVIEDLKHARLVGFISVKDLLQCFADGIFYTQPDLTIKSIMHLHPVRVTEEVDLYSLATIFIQFGFRHVPVVKDDVLIGIVSRRDVLQALNGRYLNWQKNGADMNKVPDIGAIFTRKFTIRK